MNKLVTIGNTLAQKINRIKAILKPPVTVTMISDNVEIRRGVNIPMRDGLSLSANIYKPKSPGKYPALLSLHPYCKDNLPKGSKVPFQYRVIRQSGQITFSNETGWEAPDPEFWVNQGYVIVNIDKRGFGKSPGEQEYWSDQEATDYYDAIEWVATQDWSSTKVGLFGVSYLAISQYKAAALNPPHLNAICPWEGLSDPYKDIFYPGGIREDGFVLLWVSGIKKSFGPDFRQEQITHNLRDEWYKSMTADLSKINVPALICGSFSDQLLHTRGSFRAFDQISSKHKWLYTHRSGKWAAYYTPEAVQFQLKFFDYFLKGIQNGMTDIPPVRLEVREYRDVVSSIRSENAWPLVNTKWTTVYLDGKNNTLSTKLNSEISKSNFSIVDESLQFNYKFAEDCEIVGPIKLILFVQLDGVTDMNLFAGIQKIHKQQAIYFEGSYGFVNDLVSKGFMRVALRKINEANSKPYLPEHDFDIEEPLKPGEIAKLEISLLPSATLFKKDDELCLIIQGKFLLKSSKLDQVGAYEPSTKAGRCTILGGSQYPSSLLLPFIKPKQNQL